MARPSRAKMCNWLAHELAQLVPIRPFNVMDVQELARRADAADLKLRKLSLIAGELGWHVDSSLDEAWHLIQEYGADHG